MIKSSFWNSFFFTLDELGKSMIEKICYKNLFRVWDEVIEVAGNVGGV